MQVVAPKKGNYQPHACSQYKSDTSQLPETPQSIMENQQQAQIRFMLHAWRENAIARLGFTPDQAEYCARHSVVMHDIFIDAIASAAPSIRCLEDFHQVAYYWKWIDQYGDEVYSLIRYYLDTPKRLTDNVEYDSRKRVRCV